MIVTITRSKNTLYHHDLIFIFKLRFSVWKNHWYSRDYNKQPRYTDRPAKKAPTLFILYVRYRWGLLTAAHYIQCEKKCLIWDEQLLEICPRTSERVCKHLHGMSPQSCIEPSDHSKCSELTMELSVMMVAGNIDNQPEEWLKRKK